MMSIFCSLALVSFLMMIFNSINPVKVGVALIFFSTFLFLTSFFKSGSSWFPVVFFLLFTGGILMMFMILSSLMPNQKPKKSKTSNLILVMFSSLSILNFSDCLEFSQLKGFLGLSANMSFLMVMVLIFFFSFIELMKADDMSMRSVF